METTPNTPATKNNNKKIWIIIAAAVVAVTVAATIFIITKQKKDAAIEQQCQDIIHSGVFHEGITVDGVSIGGMTTEQAKEAIALVQKEVLNQISFSLKHAETSIPVDADDYGMTFNTDEVLDEALALGRDGSLEELQAELLDIKSNGRSFTTTYSADPDYIKTFVASVAKQINTEPVNAYFELSTDLDKTAEATPAPSPNPTPAPTSTAAEAPAEPTPAPDAEDLGFFLYHEDIPGIAVDAAALEEILFTMANEHSFKDAEIPITFSEADVTLDDLKNQFTLRSTAFTSFAKSPYNRGTRVKNIIKASGLVNGTVLQPGEVFSTNGILGDRTYAGGWHPAPAIVRGRSEDQAGGGVCQVSSTIYLAVLKGDLEVVDRRGHSGKLGYVPGGLDATIDSGRIDFKWKNNTASPLYVFSWVNEADKTIHVAIYGEPLPYDEIQLSSKNVGKIPPPGEMEYQYDYSLAPGTSEVYVERKSGSIWKSYATYIKDGQIVEERFIDETRYKAYAGVTLMGPPLTGAPAPVA